jgi:hypothetical protein
VSASAAALDALQAPFPTPMAEAAALFARLGVLADAVLEAITRGDVPAMHAALDERDEIGRRLDPLVLAIGAEGVARRMAGASAASGGDGEAAAAVWSAAKDAESRHAALSGELEQRREAVARELAAMREGKAGYGGLVRRTSSVNLVR